MLSSPILTGTTAGIFYYYLIPFVLSSKINQFLRDISFYIPNFFWIYCFITFLIFVCAIGSLYTLIFKKLIDKKYIIKFFLSMIFLSPILIYLLLALLSMIGGTQVSIGINMGFGFVILALFINYNWLIVLVSTLINCFAMFFASRFTASLIKID